MAGTLWLPHSLGWSNGWSNGWLGARNRGQARHGVAGRDSEVTEQALMANPGPATN